MSILGKIMDNLEIDTSFKGNLIESVERYGSIPNSGTASTAKFKPDDRSKSASVNTGDSDGGNGVFNPGESPESGTASTAKFSKEDRKKTGGDTQVEEVKKDFGSGESVEGEKPVEVPSTGKKEEEITNKNLNLHEGAMSELDIVKQQLKSDIAEGLIDTIDLVDELIDILNPEQVHEVGRLHGYIESEAEELSSDELKKKYGTDNTDIINAGKEEKDRVTLKEEPEDENIEEYTDKNSEECTDAECSEEASRVQPCEIEIELDDNGESTNIVEVKFDKEHTKEDVDAAIKNFCGEQFFVVLDPVSSEEEDGKTKYTFEFSEFNRDEDLEAESDSIEDECTDGECEEEIEALSEPEEVQDSDESEVEPEEIEGV